MSHIQERLLPQRRPCSILSDVRTGIEAWSNRHQEVLSCGRLTKADATTRSSLRSMSHPQTQIEPWTLEEVQLHTYSTRLDQNLQAEDLDSSPSSVFSHHHLFKSWSEEWRCWRTPAFSMGYLYTSRIQKRWIYTYIRFDKEIGTATVHSAYTLQKVLSSLLVQLVDASKRGKSLVLIFYIHAHAPLQAWRRLPLFSFLSSSIHHVCVPPRPEKLSFSEQMGTWSSK